MQLLGVFCSQADSHIHTELFLKSQTLCLAEREYFIDFKEYFIEGTTEEPSHSKAVATGVTNSTVQEPQHDGGRAGNKGPQQHERRKKTHIK